MLLGDPLIVRVTLLVNLHCRMDVRMAEKLLNNLWILLLVSQKGSERMPEGMPAELLRNS